MVEFIDSHVHLADDAFVDDVDLVIARARAAGAQALVAIGESPARAVRAHALAMRYPGVLFFTCGVHPHNAAAWEPDRDVTAIRDAMRNGAVAVGECGLDYFYDNAPREVQRHVLTAQLALAAEYGKPLVLHTRSAEDDTMAFLAEAEHVSVRGVLHCFTGTMELAQRALDAGWYVSFSGIVTFRKWTDMELLRAVPDDRLLVESDAPYLAPVPHRGKRNEPAMVVRTIEHLAQARGISSERLGALTMQNTRTLFALPSSPSPEHH